MMAGVEEIFWDGANVVALIIEVAVVVIIASASARALFKCVPLIFHDTLLGENRRAIWVRYATAILLALEFALAADIIRSAIAPSWDEIGKLAAIAAIRTALNWFLAKDLETFAAERSAAAKD